MMQRLANQNEPQIARAFENVLEDLLRSKGLLE